MRKAKNMIKHDENTPLFVQSDLLQSHAAIVHFFSTRNADMDHSALLLQYFNLHASQLITGQQSHGKRIAIIDRESQDGSFMQTDAFITAEQGICLAVKTADCTPILLFDPLCMVVAAIHAGWRGTIQNITGETISLMQKTFGCDASNIVAAIGPCIGVKCYEVGDEVAGLFREQFSILPAVVEEACLPNEKSRVNVRLANYHQLLQAGISAHNIEMSEVCTFENQMFHSARRDGKFSGRMLSGIMLK